MTSLMAWSRFRLAAALLILLPAVVQADPPEGDEAAPASVFRVDGIKISQAHVTPGEPVSITAKVTNVGTARARGMTIVLGISDPSGNEVAGGERVVTGQAFAPGKGRTYRIRWRAPRELTPGFYSVSIAVYSSDGSVLHAWETRDSAFEAGPGKLRFTVPTTRVTPRAAEAGQTITVTTDVVNKSSFDASN